MSSIRFRRGTGEENATVVAPLGVLTIDTDTFKVRIHDGLTPGGQYLGDAETIEELEKRLSQLSIEDVSGLEVALASMVLAEALGAKDGLALLDREGRVRVSHLPSFVDDVLEFSTFTALPEPGTKGKLYVIIDTGFIFRWQGERYVQVATKPEFTDEIAEGEYRLYFSEQGVRESLSAEGDVEYDPAKGVLKYESPVQSLQGLTQDVVLGKEEIGLGEVEDLPMADGEEVIELSQPDSYISPALSRAIASVIGLEQDEWGWHLQGGILEVPTGPGPTKLLHGDTYLGYYGTVAPEELFTSAELTELTGMRTIGTALNPDFFWLKFAFKQRTIFIPSKSFRYNLSWDDLYMRGLVYGNNEDAWHPEGISVNQNTLVEHEEHGMFIVRLPKSHPDGETVGIPESSTVTYDPEYTHDSEWNELMYRVAATSRATGASAPIGEWAEFTNADLGLASGNGRYAISRDINNGRSVLRGLDDVSWTSNVLYDAINVNLGWRPVLEYFTPSLDLRAIDDVRYYTTPMYGFVGPAVLSEDQPAGAVSEVEIQGLHLNPITEDLTYASSDNQLASGFEVGSAELKLFPVLDISQVQEPLDDALHTVSGLDVDTASTKLGPVTGIYDKIVNDALPGFIGGIAIEPLDLESD